MANKIGKAYAAQTSAKPAAAPSVFSCPHCGKVYKTAKGLEDHLVKDHPAEPEK
ncbi:C2H2-type zinc finger protein [Gemmiger sp. An120]|uniref:C2H2-type zinc finger protein n=1 Tax=Gemmiger sp. An120 TaxID=1965549 RepID=UPI0013025DFC|nr:C2H2-type zinc finger protein [Gemmiger sp. An120]